MFEVIGMQHREYTSKKTGKPVSGWNVAMTFEDNRYEGLACVTEWLSNDIVKESGVEVGNFVDVAYNRYGRVEHITVVK